VIEVLSTSVHESSFSLIYIAFATGFAGYTVNDVAVAIHIAVFGLSVGAFYSPTSVLFWTIIALFGFAFID